MSTVIHNKRQTSGGASVTIELMAEAIGVPDGEFNKYFRK